MGNPGLRWIITHTDMPHNVHNVILEVKVLPLPSYIQRKYTDFNAKFKKNPQGQCPRTPMLGKGYVALPDSTLTSSETLGFTPNEVWMLCFNFWRTNWKLPSKLFDTFQKKFNARNWGHTELAFRINTFQQMSFLTELMCNRQNTLCILHIFFKENAVYIYCEN